MDENDDDSQSRYKDDDATRNSYSTDDEKGTAATATAVTVQGERHQC